MQRVKIVALLVVKVVVARRRRHHRQEYKRLGQRRHHHYHENSQRKALSINLMCCMCECNLLSEEHRIRSISRSTLFSP